jgi:curved DNA-binding protein CbpA
MHDPNLGFDPETNYYAVLGLTSAAGPAEIKAAWRRAATRWHPDHAGGDEEVFKRMSMAYQILADPAKKNAYDRLRSLPIIKLGRTSTIIADVDPEFPVIKLEVDLYQNGGASFDPAVHELRFQCAAAWADARLTGYHLSSNHLPACLSLALDLSTLRPRPGQEVHGAVDIFAVLRR